MSTESPLAAADIAIVDTTVFVAIPSPTDPRFRRLRETVWKSNITLKLPEPVVDELDTGYEKLPYSDVKLYEVAIDEGWATIVESPPIQHSKASTARDIARRTIASKDKKAEHEVETTDAVLAGLAVEFVSRGAVDDGFVAVLTDDRAARGGVNTAAKAVGYGDRIQAFTLAEVIGDDPGDLTII